MTRNLAILITLSLFIAVAMVLYSVRSTTEFPEQISLGADVQKRDNTARYFARVNNGEVVEVIVATQAVIDSGVFGDPSLWMPTSKGKTDSIGKGDVFDTTLKEYIPKKPRADATFNAVTKEWDIPRPVEPVIERAATSTP